MSNQSQEKLVRRSIFVNPAAWNELKRVAKRISKMQGEKMTASRLVRILIANDLRERRGEHLC